MFLQASLKMYKVLRLALSHLNLTCISLNFTLFPGANINM